MSKRVLAILTTTLLLLCIIPGLVFAADVTLELSVDNVKPGNSVTASGTADPDTWVSIKALDNAQNIVYFDAVKSGSDGNYTNTFKVPDVSPGKMTVVAGYGTNVAVKELNVQTGTSSGGGGGGGGGGVTPGSKTIGQNGGTITENGAVINIPSAAVAGNVKIKVVKVSNSTLPLAANAKLVSDVIEITKDKSDNFSKPVTITLPFDKSKVDTEKYEVSIFWLDETAGEWIELDNVKVDLSTGKVSGEINHFTKFAVLATEKASIEIPPAPGVVLKDISGHWAQANIEKLLESDAISGYPDGTFKPDNTITRAEFATVLVKAFQLEAKSGKVFNDTVGHWAKNYIDIAATNGIVQGFDEVTFGPDDLITREQMALMINNAAKLDKTADEVAFADSDRIAAWAKDAVAATGSKKIISGYPDNTFRPKANATRAEAVTVIAKALGAL